MRVKSIAHTSLLMAALILGCKKNDDKTEVVTPAHWDYENTDWKEDGYSECSGKVESPIDIDTTETVKGQLPAITFNYQDMPLQVLDNGHTIQVLGDNKNYITLKGKKYVLKQFHFHRSSEHKINGKAQDMELHLVNEDDATGDIIVLAVFLSAGTKNAVIEKIFSNFPSKQNEPNVVAGVTLNPADLLPQNKAYYNYVGSLTTPPCTEGLDWVVYKTPVTLSAEQEAQFSKIYPKNNRPTQQLNNRIVLEQN